MKDVKRDSRGGVSNQVTAVKGLINMIRTPAAHQSNVRALPTEQNADAMIGQMKKAVMPDLSNVVRAPRWVERFGRNARKGRSPV